MKKNNENLFIGFIINEQNCTYEVYLVNPTDKDYSRVVGLTGAFVSYDDDLLETSKVVKEFGNLSAYSSVLLEKSDLDGLDFVIWFHLDLYGGQGKEKPKMVAFNLPKYLWIDEDKILDLPILGIKGIKIELDKRGKNERIEDMVKHLEMKSQYHKS